MNKKEDCFIRVITENTIPAKNIFVKKSVNILQIMIMRIRHQLILLRD